MGLVGSLGGGGSTSRDFWMSPWHVACFKGREAVSKEKEEVTSKDKEEVDVDWLLLINGESLGRAPWVKECVDGEPLDHDEEGDVDGGPLDEDDDVDGVPLKENMFVSRRL
mmetsp:Transcript_7431/g.16080  ORF Transcript_7431/g.16080 Transcript_7431/m.16080 type:complete len:111 (-) Transcript_7431:839-1171(-)